MRSARSAPGLTLVELLVLVAMLVCALAGAVVAHGSGAGGAGWLRGGLLGLLLFCVGALAWLGLMDLGVGGVPRLPACRDGGCRAKDYRPCRFGDGFAWQCGHGRRYARRGRRFVALDDDGTATPYLIWRPFRGWHPE
jgi:hypothetical protein